MYYPQIMNKNIKFAVFSSLFLFASALPAFAELKTFEKQVEYNLNKADNENSARTIAIDMASKLLFQEVADSIKAESSKQDDKKSKDAGTGAKEMPVTATYKVTEDTLPLLAGILPIEITEEQLNGKVYKLKAKVSTKLDDVIDQLRSLHTDKEERKTLNDVHAKASGFSQTLANLTKQIGSASPDGKTAAAYKNAVNGLNEMEYFMQGYSLSIAGKEEAAIEAFNKCLGLNKKNAAAFTGRGYAYENMAKFDRALEDYNRAIELDPKDPANFNNRGAVYDSLKDPKRAIDDYDAAIKLDPQNAKAYSNRGTSYTAMGEFKKALEDFNKSIEIDPTVSLVYIARSINYLRLEDNESAVNDLKAAARIGNKEAQELLKQQNITW
jgi:tetratricopeptide (TPR) repeat protein